MHDDAEGYSRRELFLDVLKAWYSLKKIFMQLTQVHNFQLFLFLLLADVLGEK